MPEPASVATEEDPAGKRKPRGSRSDTRHASPSSLTLRCRAHGEPGTGDE